MCDFLVDCVSFGGSTVLPVFVDVNSSKKKGISGCGVCIFGNTEDITSCRVPNEGLNIPAQFGFIHSSVTHCITEQTGVKSMGGPNPKSQISAATHSP